MRLERLGTTDPNEKVLGLLASKTYLLITSNHANSKREHFFTGGFSFLLKNFCHFFCRNISVITLPRHFGQLSYSCIKT